MRHVADTTFALTNSGEHRMDGAVADKRHFVRGHSSVTPKLLRGYIPIKMIHYIRATFARRGWAILATGTGLCLVAACGAPASGLVGTWAGRCGNYSFLGV